MKEKLTKKQLVERVREALQTKSISEAARSLNIDKRTVAHIVWADTKQFANKRYGLFGKSNNTNHQPYVVYDPLNNLYK